jgi:nucleoside-diphosphate-sugar epimerase
VVLGPDEPVGPGDDEPVEFFEPDPPHAASASARIASENAERRRMEAILALGPKRPILPSMDVAIAGGHGKIARRLARLLVARGDPVRGLIRNPGHAADLRADGTEPVLCDLEAAQVEKAAAAIEGADAVVFAAGAGSGSGAQRKLTMDRDGAIKLLDAARSAGVERYVIVSSVGAENPPDGDDVFSVYLRAKAEADRALAASDRAWTIVRPGRLTDDPGTGSVRIGTEPVRGKVSRDNVAQVLEAVLHDPRTVHRTFNLSDGDDPVERALAAALDA